MWKAEYKITKVTTAVEKEVPCTKGFIMPAGKECDIVSSSFDSVLVKFIDGNSFKSIWMEYELKELCFETKIIRVFRPEEKAK
jgi:hypothetical protein